MHYSAKRGIAIACRLSQWRSYRGFRRFNEPDPRAPGGPRARPQNIKQENNWHTSEKKLTTNLHKVRKRCDFRKGLFHTRD